MGSRGHIFLEANGNLSKMGLHGIPNPEEDTDISGVVQIRDTLQMGPDGRLKAKDKFIFYDQSDNELVDLRI